MSLGIISADKYLSIFPCQIEAIIYNVFIYLHIPFTAQSKLTNMKILPYSLSGKYMGFRWFLVIEFDKWLSQKNVIR